MSAKDAKRFVIDTGIARAAAGPEAHHPTAMHCRDLLEAVLAQYRVIMSAELWDEWRRHKSPFTRQWLVAMTARKRIVRIDIPPNVHLRARIERTTPEQAHQAIAKDIHLVDAALATDRIIVSLDNRMRGHLGRAASLVIELQQICWVNPDVLDEEPILWLQAGAKHEQHRLLGFQKSDE